MLQSWLVPRTGHPSPTDGVRVVGDRSPVLQQLLLSSVCSYLQRKLIIPPTFKWIWSCCC